jgi:hypothetical protein
MALHSELPIYKVTYDLTVLVKRLVSQFQRNYREHGKRLDDECLGLVIQIYRANATRDKRAALSELIERLQVVELLLRLARDLRLIPVSQFAAAIELTSKIGKQATGWRKASPAV